MKSLLLSLARVLGTVWRVIPQRLRHLFFKGMFVLESRGADSGAALGRLFVLQDALELVVNERAMAYGHGEHPKHALTRYHDFFGARVQDGERVLDIGCGYGAVARSIARARPASRVLGVDYDRRRLDEARAADNPPNLAFLEADATKAVPNGPWDVVVLSNVLEHIVDRPGFLNSLIATTGATRFLIRVPMFERDWKMPLRRKLGVNYFSDSDHKIEYTEAEFREEMRAVNLRIEELITPWGEIWAALRTD